MPLTFTIRQADASDIPIVARHRAAMFADMRQLSQELTTALVDATAEYLRVAMPRGEYLAWLAEGDGVRAIGGAGVQLRPILPRPQPGRAELELGPEAIVLNVYVEAAWRRRGVGRALMSAVLEALSDRRIRRVVLHASNEGRRLYERLGFTPTNEMRLTTDGPSTEGRPMAGSARQRGAAPRHIKRAARQAKRKRTIAHLSKETRMAPEKEGAKATARKRK